ncbi:hypothetical protein GOODEAATRI_002283, partial [Goodea atripinnis]
LWPKVLSGSRKGKVWRCLLMPHLKAGNSEAPGIVHRSHNRNQIGAVRNVLLIKLHRNLIITCEEGSNSIIHWNLTAKGLRRTISVLSTRLLSNVGDATGSIFTIIERDLCPAGTLHSDRQTTSSGLPCPDAELSWCAACTWLSSQSSFQAWSTGSHFGSSALSQWTHSELEGAAWYMDTPVLHTDAVHTHLCGHEPHTIGVVAHGNQFSGLTGSRR